MNNADDQLFHTYSVRSTKDLTDSEVISELLSGSLTLIPHPSQKVGPDFSWIVDPLNDENWRFQYHCLVWLDRLRQASINQESADGIALYEKLLKSWLANNPVDVSLDDYAWFDMAVGMRAIVLLFAAKHFENPKWIIEHIRIHGQHLADPSNYEGRGNHSLHQDMGLIAIGHFLGREDWIKLASERILSMMLDAIDDEGVSREGSVDYQYRNYRWYEEAFRRMTAAGVKPPSELEKRLARMTEFMAHATSPSGHYALLGDTVFHRAPRIRKTHADWTRETSFAPADTVKVYKSGYLFARKSWHSLSSTKNSSYLTQRFGPGRALAVHGHEDAGSITLDSFGERLLCDSGLYAYEAGEDRLFFRGRASHNVVDVEGRKYYPSAESPLIFYSYEQNVVHTTVKVQGLQGVVWYRTLAYFIDDNFVLLDDRITNTLPGVVKQRWHFAEGSKVEVNAFSPTLINTTRSGNHVAIDCLSNKVDVEFLKGELDPLAGWRSDEYRKKVAVPSVAFVQEGSSVRFSNLIQWGNDKSNDWITVNESSRTSKSLRVSLVNSKKRYSVNLTSESLDISTAKNQD